jgi:hypothetical protein
MYSTVFWVLMHFKLRGICKVPYPVIFVLTKHLVFQAIHPSPGLAFVCASEATLGGPRFHTNEEVEAAAGEWLRMQGPDFYP